MTNTTDTDSHSHNDHDGWDFSPAAHADWNPWGAESATARMVGSADGYYQMLVRAEAGYRGDPHEHEHAEFSYVIEGTVRHNGVVLGPGDGYAAAAGSRHTSFEAMTDATYLVTFKL